MDFPKESVEKAQYIVKELEARSRTKGQVANMIYNGKFVEAHYGMNDAFRNGVGAIFLHELKHDADCFSRAGIDYLIAREAGLEPKIYWASGMNDSVEESTKNSLTNYEHTFVTVKVRGKECVADVQMSLKGEIKEKNDGHWIVNNQADQHKRNTKRQFSSITEIPEEDFLKQMEGFRTPEGAMHKYTFGEDLSHKGKRYSLLYDEDTRELRVNMRAGGATQIFQDLPDERCTYAVAGRLTDEGKFITDDGRLIFYDSRHIGWTMESDEERCQHFDIPMELVKKYHDNLNVAARFHGRKSPVKGISGVVTEYFLKRGFTMNGEVAAENGVDPRAHQELLESIVDCRLPNDEEVDPQSDAILAKYDIASAAATSPSNPYGYIYTQRDRNNLLRDVVKTFSVRNQMVFEAASETHYSSFGLKPDKKTKKAFFQAAALSENIFTRSDVFRSIRGASVRMFNHFIDRNVFFEEHWNKGVTATPDELREHYKREAHGNLGFVIDRMDDLRLSTFKVGLRNTFGLNK